MRLRVAMRRAGMRRAEAGAMTRLAALVGLALVSACGGRDSGASVGQSTSNSSSTATSHIAGNSSTSSSTSGSVTYSCVPDLSCPKTFYGHTLDGGVVPVVCGPDDTVVCTACDGGLYCSTMGCPSSPCLGVIDAAADDAGVGAPDAARIDDASSDGPESGDVPCNTSADCPTGEVCGFAESEACSAKGTCFTQTQCGCGASSTVGCGCDGTNVSIDPPCCFGLPTGYQMHRVLHTGPCVDGG
jgi:hypothetical protein